MAQIGVADNLANQLTKSTFGAKRQKLVTKILDDIYNDREMKKLTLGKI